MAQPDSVDRARSRGNVVENGISNVVENGIEGFVEALPAKTCLHGHPLSVAGEREECDLCLEVVGGYFCEPCCFNICLGCVAKHGNDECAEGTNAFSIWSCELCGGEFDTFDHCVARELVCNPGVG
mmetsp:Transcript_2534/g.8676  ORF Transcript_2534/g.8676 Transcript_2534/m.8676 type:complete len:126 (-) Transcript_2534:16-393(-)